MDKQKKIEEMARILTLCPRNTCVGCGMECIDYRMAKALYNAGYRKIPENGVVLTREEQQRYAAYKIIEPQIRGCLDRERELEKRLETVRKETAEKFAEMANKRIAQRQGERDCYEAFTIDDKARYDGDIVLLALFEICKEITEGK